jgi:hypothetical protein
MYSGIANSGSVAAVSPLPLCRGTQLVANRFVTRWSSATAYVLLFWLESHQRIYLALCTLIESGVQSDYMVLSNMLQKDGALESIGGISYLAALPDCMPLHCNPAQHVEEIIER